MNVIQYLRPRRWLHYDRLEVATALAESKAMILSLKTIPYQKDWFDKLQVMELKREVAGTSRIEGAVFTAVSYTHLSTAASTRWPRRPAVR